MKRIILLFLIIPSLLKAEWEQLLSLDEDPTLFHHVNVISGNLNLSIEDGVVEGAKTLPIIRTYSSAGALERDAHDYDLELKKLQNGWHIQGGWNYFPHANLLVEPHHRKEDFKAFLPEKGGNLISYTFHRRHSQDKRILFLKPEQGSGTGHLSARTDPQNNLLRLHLETGEAYLFLPDGSERKYTGQRLNKYKKKSIEKNYFHLIEETTPSKHKILYSYNKKGHLKKIEYVNPSSNKVFSWIHVHQTRLKPPFHFYVHTSDDKKITYEAIEHEEREYLSKSTSNCRPRENIRYCPGRKGIGARIQEMKLNGQLQFQVSYILPSNMKEERKWHKKPEKVNFAADKVFKIEAPRGPNNEIVTLAQFSYEPNVTEVRDVENLLTRYRHREGRLESVEYFNREGALHSTQKLHYEGKRIRIKALLDASGKELLAKTFKYDDLGNVLEETLWGNLTGEGWSSHTKRYQYLPHFNVPILEEEEHGLTHRFTYKSDTDLLTSKLTYFQDKLLHREFLFYNEDNLLVAKIVDNGTSTDFNDLSGATERSIQRYHRDPTSCMTLSVEEAYWDFNQNKEVTLKKIDFTYTKNKISKEAVYDANGLHRYTLEREYDSFGNVTKQTTPEGTTHVYQYNSLSQLVYSQEDDSLQKTYTYDAAGNPTSCQETDRSGNKKTTHSFYDSKGRLFKQIDAKGNETIQTFDSFGKCLTTQFPLVQDDANQSYFPNVHFTYDVMGNMSSTSTFKGEITQTVYNSLNNPIKIIQPDGSILYHHYHPEGTLAWTLYPDKTEIHYAYDHFQRMTHKKIFSPEKVLLSEESWNYNTFRLLSYTHPNGLTTYYFYDEVGRIVREETGTRRKTYQYDALGFVEKISEGDLAFVEIHDATGKIVEKWTESLTTAQRENYMRFFYNADHRKEKALRITSQGEAIDLFAYDDGGRIVQHTDPLGYVTKFLYNDFFRNDLNQNVLQKTILDPLNNSSIETFDASNRLVLLQKKNPAGELVSQEEFFYDRSGNKTRSESTLFQDNKAIKKIAIYWEYDQAGRVIKEKGPLDKITTYAYDVKGRISQKTLPSGVTLAYSYDGLDRLIEITSSDGTLHYQYTYNHGNQPTHIYDPLHHLTLDLEYNLYGELTQETDGDGRSYQWQYDELGQRTRFILPDHSSIAYQYQDQHLVSVQRISPSDLLLYEHRYTERDKNGHVTEESLIQNLGKVHTEHDLLERPLSQISDYFVASLNYGPSGLVMASDNSLVGNKQYLYDPLNQLLQEGKEHYHFDSLGNPLQCEINDHNQILSASDGTLRYDANGNPTEYLQKDKTLTYTYDAWGRLTSLTLFPRRKVEFLYDPLSRLYSKTTYRYSRGWILEEHCNYLYDHAHEIGTQKDGHITELKVLGLGIQGDIGAAIALECNDAVYAPLHDFSGNIIALIDSQEGKQGQIAETYRMNAFGKEENPSKFNPWRFNSKRHEEGLIFFGQRFYDPHLGRWLTPDPSGYSDGPNLYAYVLNSPLNRLDLFGLASEFRAPFSLPDFRIEVPIYKIDALSNGVGFLTAKTFIDGNGPNKIHFGCDWNKLQFSPEELKVGKVNLVDHFNEIVPKQGNVVGVLSLINGINVSKRELKSYGQHLYGSIPELSEGMIYLGLYNKSYGLFVDNQALNIKHLLFMNLPSVARHRQHLVAFNSHFKKINPELLWMHLAHSEGGLITRRAIEGMTPDQKKDIQKSIFSLTLGSVAPIPKKYAKEAFNVVSDADYASKAYMFDYKYGRLRTGEFNVEIVPSIATSSQKILGLIDHNFLSPTYTLSIENKIEKTRARHGIYSNQTR